MKTTSLKNAIFMTSALVLVLWFIKSLELLFNINLVTLGVFPQDLRSLFGIFTAPLIHGSLSHLFKNTLAMLLLGTFLFYGYPVSRFKALGFVWLVSGLCVWLFARGSYHIGASGITHGMFFYLFSISIIRRDKRSVAIMMASFFMFGGMTMSIFPRDPNISFEYHLFGAISGVIAAMFWRNADPKPIEKTYDWERDSEEGTLDLDWDNDTEDINSRRESGKETPISNGTLANDPAPFSLKRDI